MREVERRFLQRIFRVVTLFEKATFNVRAIFSTNDAPTDFAPV